MNKRRAYKLSDGEIAAILWGLRRLQSEIFQYGSGAVEMDDHFDEAPLPSTNEIEALCEVINMDCIIVS